MFRSIFGQIKFIEWDRTTTNAYSSYAPVPPPPPPMYLGVHVWPALKFVFLLRFIRMITAHFHFTHFFTIFEDLIFFAMCNVVAYHIQFKTTSISYRSTNVQFVFYFLRYIKYNFSFFLKQCQIFPNIK